MRLTGRLGSLRVAGGQSCRTTKDRYVALRNRLGRVVVLVRKVLLEIGSRDGVFIGVFRWRGLTLLAQADSRVGVFVASTSHAFFGPASRVIALVELVVLGARVGNKARVLLILEWLSVVGGEGSRSVLVDLAVLGNSRLRAVEGFLDSATQIHVVCIRRYGVLMV
jgi:hypothetical protein